MITKNIGYAYPSSQLANMLDFGKSGCYYLALYDDSKPLNHNDVYFAHKDMQTVKDYSKSYTNLSWGKYSMYKGE